MTPRQQLDALIDLFAPQIRDAFLAAIQDIVDNTILGDVIDAIVDGDVERAFQVLGFSEAAMRPLTAMIETAYETGGVLTGRTFPKYLNTPSGRAVFRFDVRNSRAEAYLRDQSSELVTRIADDTRVNIRNVLTTGMQDGRNPRNVALDIIGRIDPTTKQRVGGIVGLTKQQEAWSRNVREKLLDTRDYLERERLAHPTAQPTPGSHPYFSYEMRDKRFDRTVEAAIRNGKPLPVDVVDKLVLRYKDNALKLRGEMIARTEALHSLNAAEWEATKQAVAMGATSESAVQREWDSAGDKRVRNTHKEMNGQRVGLNAPFVSPSGARLMHPGDTSLGAGADEVILCRCRVRTVIDWLADIGDDEPKMPVPFSGADYMKQFDNPDVTPASVLASFPPDTGAKIAATQKRLEALVATDKLHSVNGVYSAEREALHNRILYEGVHGFDPETGGKRFYPPLIDRDRVAAARPMNGGQPTFTILGGRGGSGKSAFDGVRFPDARVYDREKVLLFDADVIKHMLPEFEGFNANQVHEESSFILGRAIDRAKALRANIVLDGTLKSRDSALNNVLSFQNDGYRVEAHYMHLPREEAAKRAVARYLGPTGRYVPPEVILGNVRNEANFDEIARIVDDWSFRDNNVPRGQPPKLIARKGR
jgi:predicted ABC-type ATPase